MPGRKAPKRRNITAIDGGEQKNITAVETNNRPDEWRIEQGLAGAKLPIIDQSQTPTTFIHPVDPGPPSITDEEAINAVGDRTKLFAREKNGWEG